MRSTVTRSDLLAQAAGVGWPGIVARAAGGLAALSALVSVVAAYQPYLVLSGQEVVAPVTVSGVLAQLVFAGPVVVAGLLALSGRGGRFGLSALVPAAAAAVGSVVQIWYDARPPNEHPSLEFYFGRSYSTTSVRGAIGHDLALTGQLGLVVVMVLIAVAWPRVGVAEGAPMGRDRGGAAGFVLSAGVLGSLALMFPPAVGVLKMVTGADGIEEVVPIAVPAGPLDGAGLMLTGGLLLSVGLLAAACALAVATSRVTMLGALIGMAAYFGSATLSNLRDIGQNSELLGGLRTYTLLAATLVALVGGWYAARVQHAEDDALRSAPAARLGLTEEETK